MNKLARRVLALSVATFAFGAVVVQSQAQDDSSGKLTLREAVTMALQNSRDLALARVQYNVALNEASVDRGEFRPNLYTGSGAAYTSGYPSVPGGGLPSLFDLAYSQSLFNLPLKGQLKAAADRANSAKIEVDRTRDDVIVQTASTYLELANVGNSLELMRGEQASAQKILGVIRDRVAANQELPIEETRGELTVARTQQHIIQLEDRDEILSEQIRNLTGIPEDHTINVSTTEEDDFSVLPATQEESQLLDLALHSDAGIREAEDERAARQHILKGARGGYWPTVSIVGDYQLLARFNNYKLYFNPNAPFQRNEVVAGIQVTVPIFSAKTRANIALAKSQLQVAEISLSAKRQQVSVEVRQKNRDVRETEANREVARLDVELARQNLDLLQARLDQGRATLQDVEQARLDENEKWMAFLDTDLARQRAQLILLQATGQLAKVFQ